MKDKLRISIPTGPGLTAAIYAASLLLIFAPFLLEPGSLYARVVRDFWPLYNSLPEFDLGHRVMFNFEQHQFPLWNFLNGFGQPLLGDLQSAPFHPARLLFFLPFWKVIDVWLLLRVFISGMLAYGVLRRQGAGWHGATMGGLAWMLTGSITDYINMHYLDVDLLLPAGVWSFGVMARRQSIGPVLCAALVITLVFLGGNPTSILYFLIFVSLYYFYVLYRLREDVLGGYIRFFSVAALSGLATAVLLLPFREFLANSWDYHPAGVGTLCISVRHLLTALGPEVYGPELENGIPLMQRIPYMGVVPFFLAALSIFFLRRMVPATPFYVAVLMIFGGLVVGAMPFFLINHLPLFIRASNFRYAVPEAAFCVAMLAGLGWDHLTRWREGIWRILFFPILLSIISAALLGAKLGGAPVLPVKGYGLLLFVGVAWSAALVILFHRRQALSAGLAGLFLIALWVMEAGFHVHRQKPLVPNTPKTFTSRPGNMDQRILLEGRVYAAPGILYPNLNVLHGAMDIRYLGALYVERYARFMRAINNHSPYEQLIKFLPYNYIDLHPDILESPVMDLMGITTILSDVTLPRNKMVGRLYRSGHVIAPSDSHVITRNMAIDGDMRVTLYQHPPSRLEANFPVGYLMFGIGIDPSRWDKEGDGVTFSIYREKDNRLKRVFARHLDPAHIPEERAWFDFVIPHPGGKIIFETTPGINDSNDWAGWGDIRSSEGQLCRYDLIKYTPIKVYENYSSLLGAFMVGELKIVKDMEDAARALSRGFNFRRVAIVEGPESYSLRVGLGSQENYKINLERYLGDRVTITAYLENAGVMVLNDAYYPGWKAYVDGEETRIFPADVAFRAIKVPEGKHRVKFIYQPQSFRIGLWSSIATLFMMLGVVNNYIKRKRLMNSG